MPRLRRLAAVGLPFAAFVACSRPQGPIARTLGPPVVNGNLTLTPIQFATTDFYFYPKTVEAEEGRLRVADGVEIHFVRFRSTAANPGPPIVYLAGGPGGSGTLSASGDRFPLFMRMREVADVIALDQRGTALTRPHMICPGAWEYPLDQPADQTVLAGVLEPFMRQCARFWSDSVDLSAFNTRQSAEDLDALRQALGAERLNLWGISYGTHLGLAYIRYHGDRVHRAILAGIEGPDHTYKLPANLDAVFLRLDSVIRGDPRTRAVIPDLAGGLRRTLSHLRDPAEVMIDGRRVVVGAIDLQMALFFAMGERPDIAQIPERLAPILQSDYTNLARWALRARAPSRELVMSIAMDCASGASPERQKLIGEQAATALFGDVANITLRATCAAWPPFDLGNDYRSPLRSDVPALFISGTLDIRTPPSNAEEVLAGFPNGRHLVIEGGSHDDDLFLSSPEIGAAMLAFLRADPLPVTQITLPPIRFRLP